MHTPPQAPTKHIVILLASVLFPILFAVNAHATDWPMGRGNSQGTGATKTELPTNLELIWEVNLKGLGFDAGPIIADGTVFANDHDGRVIAIDLETGKERWRLELDTAFVASPAYRDSTLFVADIDGVLRALDAADGQEKWSFETELEIDASPNFYKQTILVTSQDGTLYAISAESGQLSWKYETGDQLQCGAALAGDRTFLGGCDGHLHIVDVKTGKAVGEPIELDGPTGSTPAVLNGTVFVPTYSGAIFAFQTPANEKAWMFRDEKLSSEFKNSVALADGLAIATSRNKRVFAIDVETGKPKWVQVLRKRADASPVIAGQSVIVAAADGRILRFDLKTGEQQWMFEVKGSFIGSPAVADGKLVLTNDRGTIFCFGTKD